MVLNRIRQALILATNRDGAGKPVALASVGGLPLLKRTLLTLAKKGIRQAFVVAEEAVVVALRKDPQLGVLDIQWTAVDPEMRQGDALLAGRALVRGDFFLVQGDLVFDPAVIDRLQDEPLDGITLAVGCDVADERAIPLWVGNDGRVVAQKPSGAALARTHDPAFAAWVGVATCDSTLFDVLDHLAKRDGLAELAGAIDYLRTHGAARAAFVDSSRFHSVRTEDGRKSAERMLLDGLRKPQTDGLVASLLNRRFSLAVTRLLMDSNVRPNHVTGATLLLSVLAAWAGTQATPHAVWWLGIGAVLWQLASMLDGTDGELARLRFQSSRLGEWFDTLTDDAGRVLVFLGLGYGTSQVTGDSLGLNLAIASVALQVSVNITIYRKLLAVGAGSHFALGWTARRLNLPSWISAFTTRIQWIARRDGYIFSFMCLILLGWFEFAFALTFLVTLAITVHEMARPRQARGRILGTAIATVSGPHS